MNGHDNPSVRRIADRRKAVAAAYADGLSHKAIAERVGCGIATVRRDLRALRDAGELAAADAELSAAADAVNAQAAAGYADWLDGQKLARDNAVAVALARVLELAADMTAAEAIRFLRDAWAASDRIRLAERDDDAAADILTMLRGNNILDKEGELGLLDEIAQAAQEGDNSAGIG